MTHGLPLVLGFGALGAWLLLRKSHAPVSFAALPNAPGGSASLPAKKWNITSASTSPSKVPTVCESPSASTGNYLQHLANAADKVNRIQSGADTHEESQAVNEAWNDLSAPMDTLTVQKDLNVLGAQPPLVEDGVYGPKTKDAIDSFQAAMLLERTGQMNSSTNNALRRAVVAATMQQTPA